MSDPVQATRKAAIKREAKRNRERKEQAHEARTLRQDTTALERQIRRLEARQNILNQQDVEELERLRTEVVKVKRIKEEYIRKHPNQRNFVRGYEDNATSSFATKQAIGSSSSFISSRHPSAPSLTPQSTTRDPRWSVYYDHVFNPYGAPPPGMPYVEKTHAQLIAEGLSDAAKPPPLPEEAEDMVGSQDETDGSSVDEDLKDIIMPSGPPPIRLLPGNQNGSAAKTSGTEHGRGVSGTSRGRGKCNSRGGRGRGSGTAHHQGGWPGPTHNARLNQNSGSLPPRPLGGFPARPPQLMATNVAPTSFAQSSESPRPPGPPPSLPDGVVISAEPQLRDLKKESTAFVPAAIRKKQAEEKARAKRGLPGRIDAAPIAEDMFKSASASYKDRADLLKSVQAHLPPKGADGSSQRGKNSSRKEYNQFLSEVGDLL
ncbi:uncharacterized protein MEPE_03555 [Melanopsichium pennsylvanicum]|uniref:Wbp11/ELF5/Saf1 N-terminal domain-containing protein n=1 Tax=Melanopsichium pennsylvanicum TaxID=63383 RepID=A0AAJ4XMY8_9BASI|nr:uncharacterized protein MEPE_03555 [Melanopsichium pennsylvanicum]